MNKIILLAMVLFLAVYSNVFSQGENKSVLPDGLYLIIEIDSSGSDNISLPENSKLIQFNKHFKDYTGLTNERLIIDTTDYVPLELDKSPETQQQTDEKKILLLTLSKLASEKLKTFSSKNVMKKVTIVVDGEALTFHKIREPITGGQLQITRCTDNACELLYVKLKDNIK